MKIIIYLVVGLLALIGAVALGFIVLVWSRLHQRQRLLTKEERTLEPAPWIGTTGLGESIERELPRYLRREFGQTLFDADALKAADLHYHGVFQEGAQRVHYWRIARAGRDRDGDTTWAYVAGVARWRTKPGLGRQSPAAALKGLHRIPSVTSRSDVADRHLIGT